MLRRLRVLRMLLKKLRVGILQHTVGLWLHEGALRVVKMHGPESAAFPKIADPLPEGHGMERFHRDGVHNTLELVVVKVDDERHGVVGGTSLVERLQVLREIAVTQEGWERWDLGEGDKGASVPTQGSRDVEGPVGRVRQLRRGVNVGQSGGKSGRRWRRGGGACWGLLFMVGVELVVCRDDG